jgi:hypothetical protein
MSVVQETVTSCYQKKTVPISSPTTALPSGVRVQLLLSQETDWPDLSLGILSRWCLPEVLPDKKTILWLLFPSIHMEVRP